MTKSAEKIADALIANSRGILSRAEPRRVDNEIPPPPHVMQIETYRARFGALEGEKLWK